MKIRSNLPLETCPDCNNVHLGRCGGLSFAERLRSVAVDTFWMEGKNATGYNYQRENYIDTQALKDTFGDDSDEIMMEETQGRGAITSDEFNTLSDKDKAFYLGDDLD